MLLFYLGHIEVTLVASAFCQFCGVLIQQRAWRRIVVWLRCQIFVQRMRCKPFVRWAALKHLPCFSEANYRKVLTQTRSTCTYAQKHLAGTQARIHWLESYAVDVIIKTLISECFLSWLPNFTGCIYVFFMWWTILHKLSGMCV